MRPFKINLGRGGVAGKAAHFLAISRGLGLAARLFLRGRGKPTPKRKVA